MLHQRWIIRDGLASTTTTECRLMVQIDDELWLRWSPSQKTFEVEHSDKFKEGFEWATHRAEDCDE